MLACAGFAACSSEPLAESNVSTTQLATAPNDATETTAGILVLPAETLAQFMVQYPTNAGVRIGGVDRVTVAEARSKAIEALMARFVPYLRKQYSRDQEEFASFTLAVDNKKGGVFIETADVYKTQEMNALGLLALGITLTNAETIFDEAYMATIPQNKVRLTCESGAAKGNQIEVDASETRPWQGTAVGKQVVAFVENSLDKGDTAKVSRVRVIMQ